MVEEIKELALLRMNVQQYETQLIAQNIALANTPDATLSKLDKDQFKTLLLNALGSGADLSSLASPQSLQAMTTTTSPTTEVSLDELIADLNASGSRYKTTAALLNRKYGLMQVVTGGQ